MCFLAHKLAGMQLRLVSLRAMPSSFIRIVSSVFRTYFMLISSKRCMFYSGLMFMDVDSSMQLHLEANLPCTISAQSFDFLFILFSFYVQVVIQCFEFFFPIHPSFRYHMQATLPVWRIGVCLRKFCCTLVTLLYFNFRILFPFSIDFRPGREKSCKNVLCDVQPSCQVQID